MPVRTGRGGPTASSGTTRRAPTTKPLGLPKPAPPKASPKSPPKSLGEALRRNLNLPRSRADRLNALSDGRGGPTPGTGTTTRDPTERRPLHLGDRFSSVGGSRLQFGKGGPTTSTGTTSGRSLSLGAVKHEGGVGHGLKPNSPAAPATPRNQPAAPRGPERKKF